jgi:hypothetical protein
MVLVGYAKCPKCHAPMPAAAHRAKRASFQGGGTSSQPIEPIDAVGGAGGGPGWIVPVGIIVVASVVVWATVLRGDDAKKKPAEAAAPVENGPGTDVLTPSPPPTGNDQAVAPTLQTRPDPAYVADALEAELSVERLFSTVEVSSGTLEVRSAFCADPRFSEITAKYVAELKSSGLLRIRCSETHGAQVFERAL